MEKSKEGMDEMRMEAMRQQLRAGRIDAAFLDAEASGIDREQLHQMGEKIVAHDLRVNVEDAVAFASHYEWDRNLLHSDVVRREAREIIADARGRGDEKIAAYLEEICGLAA